MSICGIYSISNINTGRVYIGSAENIEKRWAKHQTILKCNAHWNSDLQSAYNEDGINSFSFSVVEECHPHKLIERETHHIEALGWPSRVVLYNRRLPLSTQSDETRQLMSDNRKGVRFTDEHRRNISESISKVQQGKKRGPYKKRSNQPEKHNEE